MENPSKFTVISVIPYHAREGVRYDDTYSCAFYQACVAVGLPTCSVGASQITIFTDKGYECIKLTPKFTYQDFRDVRSGATIEHLYDPSKQIATRIENGTQS